MTPVTLIIIGLVALVVGLLIVGINMACMVNRFSMKGINVLVHLFGGFIAWLGGIAMLGGGVWFIVSLILAAK